MPPAIIAAAIGVGGSIGGAALASHAAGQAADAQTDAANQAGMLQFQAAEDAIAFQREQAAAALGLQQQAMNFGQQVYGQQQANAYPFLQAGQGAVVNLANLLGVLPQGGAGAAPQYAAPRPAAPMNIGSPSFSQTVSKAPGGLPIGYAPQLPGARPPTLAGLGGRQPLTMNRMGATATVQRVGGGFTPSQSDINNPVPRFGAGSWSYNNMIFGKPGQTPGLPANAQRGQQYGPWSFNAGLNSWQYVGNSFRPATNQPLLPRQAAAPAQAINMTGARPLGGMINPALGARGSLLQDFGEKFQAPNNVTEQNDPGFQFRLQQGQQALERSAAGRGDLLTGGFAKALGRYNQDYASNEYGNVYDRALQQYQQRYNIFEQNQANRFNRLASLAGMGQTSVGQLNSAGSSAAGNYSDLAGSMAGILGNSGSSIASMLMGAGQQQGNALQNAAYQRGSGYTASASPWANVLGNIGNYASLAGLFGGGSPSFGGMSPTQISSAYGGPGQVPLLGV